MVSKELRYTTVPGKLKVLFDKIRDVGRPERVSNSWLASIGFSSSNDRSMIPILRQIAFIAEDGVPTELWDEYRGHGGASIAKGLKIGYADLFALYSNAHERSTPELESYVKVQMPKLGQEAVSKIISTFRALTNLADFDAMSDEIAPAHLGDPIDVPFKPREIPSNVALGGSPHFALQQAAGVEKRDSAVINLHIHLPVLAGDATDGYRLILRELRGVLWNTDIGE